MHRTLFTPSMVETYRICRRAYELAFANYEGGSSTRTSLVLKRYLKRALADVNRGKIETINQIQKHIGQHWPHDVLTEEVADPKNATRAFLFAYKILTHYVAKPYKPDDAEVKAVALRVRARIAHVRVYIEDTFDLVLFYPKERCLEIVDFQMQPIKKFEPLWPSHSILLRQHLAERLQSRWPFEKLSITQFRLCTETFQSVTQILEDSICKLHWPGVLKTLEELKTDDGSRRAYPSNHNEHCHPCKILDSRSGGRYIVKYDNILDMFQLTA